MNHLEWQMMMLQLQWIVTGKQSKVMIVSTPHGMNMYYKIWNDAIHKRNDYVPIEVHWSEVPGRDDKWKEETIRNTSEAQHLNFLGQPTPTYQIVMLII